MAVQHELPLSVLFACMLFGITYHVWCYSVWKPFLFFTHFIRIM